MPDSQPRSQASQAVWGGEDRYLLDRATQVPVVHSVAFGYPDFDEWYDVATGKAGEKTIRAATRGGRASTTRSALIFVPPESVAMQRSPDVSSCVTTAFSRLR